ncbi:hypothetical protein GVN20_12425 [Runella sp. CRIBMP]|uniref:transposase family protein n=1 Tax=Runella sp. CRIBMP TaxID=2683261 RepID=UPI0014129EB3|nr:transposase family protein [Runella sp. CRIBMP]NBB20161.1 hypothetical protein [Runella sp. CRIBMP]
MIFINICAVRGGCEDYMGIHLWAKDNLAWLRQYLKLDKDVPSDDTLGRVFRFLDYESSGRIGYITWGHGLVGINFCWIS